MPNYATYTSWLPATSNDQSHLIFGLTNSDIKTGTIQSLITRRESFVNNFLEPKYSTPISNCSFITHLVEDLITYDIWKLLIGRDGTLDPAITDQYNIALNTLTRLQEGKQGLVSDSGTTIAIKNSTSRFYTTGRNYTHTFNVDNELNWKVSPGRVDDVTTDRGNDV
jgi:hypothetical protein